jgi:LmbE family N-acetylglucosaminyl deacetylase
LTPAPRALAFVLFLFITAAHAQQAAAPQTVTIDTKNLGVRPEVLDWDKGEIGLHLLFKKLKTTGRLMMLDAHPDDEDGPTLTYLARGKGYKVLLMSLTRGEGGQNRTGSNLWDELGVLRTLELLESTRYYGTELRFSRVADFGFSKSADEAFKKWGGHEVPLRDIVYVIREWKPDVLVARFSGTPRDGHGMHQASAILAPEAVKCAADPNCFPDQLKGDHALTTWQVLKLYMGNQGGAETNVAIDVGQIDPDTKLSYFRMAMEGFRHQASQLSGTLTVPASPNWRSYKLTYSAIPDHQPKPGLKEQDFFDGIDTSVRGLATRIGKSGKASSDISKAADLLDRGVSTGSAQALIQFADHFTPATASILNNGVKSSVIESRLQDTIRFAQEAANQILGLEINARADGSEFSAGERLRAFVDVRNGGKTDSHVKGVFVVPTQSSSFAVSTPIDQRISAGESSRFNQVLQVPDDLPLTRPTWFRTTELETVYQSTDPSPRAITIPKKMPPFFATGLVEAQGEQSKLSSPLLSNQKNGSAVSILPAASVFFAQNGIIATPAQNAVKCQVVVSVRKGMTGTLRLIPPDGWKVEPPNAALNLSAPGQQRTDFVVSYPTNFHGGANLHAEFIAGKKKFAEGASTVTRDDLDTFYYYQPAIQRVSIVDVNIPKSLRVGYIPGAGDDIFPVLQQLGLNAKLVSDQELASGDLHQYDTIVVGIRGYDERLEIRDNNQRLLDFVKDGGTLIVQNQKAEDVFNSGKFTPYAATLGRERVSVEEAPVEVLAPKDPIFNSPNKITAADFDGWVQERGVNFMSDWDSHFEPLLASNDPGESPLKGGMLRAKYGKGTYAPSTVKGHTFTPATPSSANCPPASPAPSACM